jgi:hypothetical protein
MTRYRGLLIGAGDGNRTRVLSLGSRGDLCGGELIIRGQSRIPRDDHRQYRWCGTPVALVAGLLTVGPSAT